MRSQRDEEAFSVSHFFVCLCRRMFLSVMARQCTVANSWLDYLGVVRCCLHTNRTHNTSLVDVSLELVRQMPAQSTLSSVSYLVCISANDTRHTSALYQLRISLCFTSINRIPNGIRENKIGIKSLNRRSFWKGLGGTMQSKKNSRSENRDQQFVRISINTSVIVSLQQIDASCRRSALFAF